MSKFENFLSGSEKINIEHSMSSNDSNSYFMNALKKNVKTLSILALLIPMSVSAVNNKNMLNEMEISNIIENYSVNHEIPFENTKVIYSNVKNGTHSLHEMGKIDTCKIIISSTGGGDFEKLMDSHRGLNKKYYEEMVITHEMSHCITDKKFIGAGLSYDSEKWMEDLITGEYVSENQLKDIFEENFSDTLAALTLLKNNNFSPTSVAFLKKWESVRRDINSEAEQNGSYFEDHNTADSIKYILEHLEELKYVNSSDFIKISNNLASQSVMRSINSNREVEKDFIIDENGNIKSSGKKKLDKEGINVFANSVKNTKKSIRDITVNIIHDYYKTGIIKENNSIVYNISKSGFLFFNNKGEDNSIESSINSLDNQLFKGTYYNKLIDKTFSDNDFLKFKKEIKNVINNPPIEYSIQFVLIKKSDLEMKNKNEEIKRNVFKNN